MKTLATQFQLLKENKGNKDVFLKTAKTKYPSYVPQSATFNEAVNILKQKGIINENIIDLMPINTNVVKKESFELAFSSFLKEAKKKDTVENTIDKTDKKNPDNLIFDQIMAGCYVEAKNVKNKDKSIDEIKDIVVKNLSKDPIYYTKNAAFKVDGLGYKDDAPGLGTPKEAKGKYKSSGYGDIDKKFLNENKTTKLKIGDILTKNGKKGKIIKVMSDMVNVDFGNGDVYGITLSRIKGNEIVNENKGWDSKNDTPEIKKLMSIADDTSNSPSKRDMARQKAYKLRQQIKGNEIVNENKIETIDSYIKSEKDPKIKNTLTKIRSKFLHKDKLTDVETKLINKLIPSIKESETRSVGPMTKPTESTFKVGDMVINNGIKHRVTRIEGDKIYIKKIMPSNRPEIPVKAQDLKKAKTNESRSNKFDIMHDFVKTYADYDESGLFDMEAEITDIYKFSALRKNDFINKVKFGYPKAKETDIADLYDSIKGETQMNESNTNDTGDLFDMLGIKQDIIDMFEKGYAPEDIIDQLFDGNDRYLRAVTALGDSLQKPTNESTEANSYNVGDIVRFPDGEEWLVVKPGMRHPRDRRGDDEITMKPYNNVAKSKYISLPIDFKINDLADTTLNPSVTDESINEYEEDEETYEFNVGEDSHYGKVKSRKMVGNKLHVTFDTNKTYEFEKFMGKWVENKQINESYGSNSDFDGTGLVVVGRTQLDNNEIADMVDDGDYYGVWNGREGYWFFPEGEETLDSLEMELEQEFTKRGINARFEAQFDEDGIDYDDENFSDPLIDGEEDLFEYEKNMSENILIDIENQLLDANIGDMAYGGGYGPFKKVTRNTWKNVKAGSLQHSNKLASFIGTFDDFRIESSKSMSENILTAKNYKDFYLFESENEKPTEIQLSKMKDKLESYVDKIGNYEEAVAKYLKMYPNDKKYKNTLLSLAEPLFESENKKPTESQLSKMKDKLESYVDKANNTTEAVSMYLKRFPQDKKYKNILMTLAEPLF
jgi:hypothetical protein